MSRSDQGFSRVSMLRGICVQPW